LALRTLHHLPQGFLESPACELIRTLPEPTLFDLPGRIDEPLFVSVLLHGDEETGLIAVQEVLRRHRDRGLPRRLLLFVGNVDAAAARARTLDGQLDFNRAWPGTPHPSAPQALLMREVVDYVAAQRPFASIDLHNNTGLNPHYACLNRLEHPFLHLARLFSRTVVYFERPLGVQSAAMARVCPAVTVECGRTSERSGTDHAIEFVEACLALSRLPDHPPRPADFDLLRTFAIVKVPAGTTFSFDGTAADIRFRPDIDRLNFSEAAPGTSFGRRAPGTGVRLDVTAGTDAPVPDYFDYADDEIRLAEPAIPAMLTRDIGAVRVDCLCYLMRRIGLDGRPTLACPG
jgi:uncharacterized protein